MYGKHGISLILIFFGILSVFLKGEAMSFTIESPAFQNGQEIPSVYTCQGRDISPPLAWSGIPAGTKSLALTVFDPDAPDPANPRMTWVHWVLYNLPPESSGLPEGAGAGSLPPGTGQGLNDWKRTGYGGPCPPIGRHRYFFRLYALDSLLPDMGAPTMKELLHAIKGHVLGEAELMGTYQKR